MKIRVEVGGREAMVARVPEAIARQWLVEGHGRLVVLLSFWVMGGLQRVLGLGERVTPEEVAARLEETYGAEVDPAVLGHALSRLERSGIVSREGEAWVRRE